MIRRAVAANVLSTASRALPVTVVVVFSIVRKARALLSDLNCFHHPSFGNPLPLVSTVQLRNRLIDR